MIKKVTLKNFQAHKLLEVDCAGFTTLTGGSNGGKSAVLRAIQGLVRNDSVADYVRHGQKTLSVKLEFDEGFSVEWVKGDGTNRYVLITSDGTEHVFDKVGSDVPDEVKEVLRLGPVAIKGSDKEYVNFHNQLEAPFLISSTAGNVAKLFGELTSASDLYLAVSDGNKQTRSINALKTTRKADYDEAEIRMDAFFNLDEQLEDLENGKAKFNESVGLWEDLNNITDLTSKITSKNLSIQESENLVTKLQPIEQIDLSDLDSLVEVYVGVSALLEKAVRYDEYELKATGLVNSLSPVRSVDLQELEDAALHLSELKSVVGGASDLGVRMTALHGSIDSGELLIEDLEHQIVDKIGELETCPECDQDLSDGAKVALIEGRSEHATC